jgi:hypothetical protein
MLVRIETPFAIRKSISLLELFGYGCVNKIPSKMVGYISDNGGIASSSGRGSSFSTLLRCC